MNMQQTPPVGAGLASALSQSSPSSAPNAAAADPPAPSNQTDRSDAALTYLIAHAEVARTNAVNEYTRCASLGSTGVTAAMMPHNPAAAAITSLSQVDRSDECIDYLIAHTHTRHSVATEEAMRLREKVQTNMMRWPHSTPYGFSSMPPYVGAGMMSPHHSCQMPSPYYNPMYPSRFPILPLREESFKPAASATADVASAKKKARIDLKSVWGRRYSQLVHFKQAHGHCNVPQRFPANVELGRWVKDQRTFKVKGKISQERIDLLDSIGFQWKVRCHDEFWDKRVQDLIAFKEVHGHCNVSLSNTDNMQLARWVDRTRRAKKAGKISQDKFKQLDDLGFWVSR